MSILELNQVVSEHDLFPMLNHHRECDLKFEWQIAEHRALAFMPKRQRK